MRVLHSRCQNVQNAQRGGNAEFASEVGSRAGTGTGTPSSGQWSSQLCHSVNLQHKPWNWTRATANECARGTRTCTMQRCRCPLMPWHRGSQQALGHSCTSHGSRGTSTPKRFHCHCHCPCQARLLLAVRARPARGIGRRCGSRAVSLVKCRRAWAVSYKLFRGRGKDMLNARSSSRPPNQTPTALLFFSRKKKEEVLSLYSTFF